HNPHWRNVKLAEIKSIITACSGLYLQASSAEQFGVKGTSVSVNIEAINRSRAKMEVTNVTFSGIDSGQVVLHQELKTNRDFQQKVTLQLPKSLQYTSPYWLRAPHGIGMYQVDKQPLIGLPETPPQVVASFDLVINGTQISFQRPVVYKTSSPAKGEVEKPFAIVPKVSLQMAANTLIFPDETPKTIAVSVKAFADEITGSLRLQAPDNWTIEPKTIPIN